MKFQNKNKSAMTQMKALFLIMNMLIAMVAFSWMVSGVGLDELTDEQLTELADAQYAEDYAVGAYSPAKSPVEPTKLPLAGGVSAGTIVASSGIKTYTVTAENGVLIKGIGEGGKDVLLSKGTTFTENLDTGKITALSGKETITIEKSALDGAIGEKNIIEGATKAAPTETGSTLSKFFKASPGMGMDAILSGAQYALVTFFVVKMAAGLFGASKSTTNALSFGAAAGIGTWKFFNTLKSGKVYDSVMKVFGDSSWSPVNSPGLWGVGVGVLVFALMYKKESKEVVEFNCLPYQPPIGGTNCELCNEFEECSEYTCKSLGQACDLVNQGTTEQKCIWKNPNDVNSPQLRVTEVIGGYKYVPDTNIRPPATGVVISQEEGGCVKAFTPLEFTLETDEPAQCKVDYNLTRGFEEMSYYVGGTNAFSYNHTEKMSLPSPDTLNAIAPELKNDGTYTLYVRCQDGNGNFNQDPYSVRFCVEKGPDTTAPFIRSVNVPSNSPIGFGQTELNLEVYVNEPADCKWSREDKDYNLMENLMSCDKNVWEMNNENTYTCKTTLTGIQDRTENDYYIRCKDQPYAEEADRNVNIQSYLYKLVGTQPLNILSVGPNGTIYGATETIPVELTIKTDNGYNNGEAICYYSITNNETDYIEFLETGTNVHVQRQDLATGDYTYYLKCVDLGGNADYNKTTFRVETDKSAPLIVRAYKESGQLKIITNEEAECSYSIKDCNFEISDGIKLETINFEAHAAEWKTSQNYYIRCKDRYNNQANPNTCSMIIRPYQIFSESNVVVL